VEEIVRHRKLWNPPAVGIVLDSSVIVAAERRAVPFGKFWTSKSVQGESEIGVSVVTIAELVQWSLSQQTEAHSNDGWIHRAAFKRRTGASGDSGYREARWAHRRPAGS